MDLEGGRGGRKDKGHRIEMVYADPFYSSPAHPTCGFTHPIYLMDWDIDTHEVSQCLLGDWGSPCHWEVTLVQAKSTSDLLEKEGIGQ